MCREPAISGQAGCFLISGAGGGFQKNPTIRGEKSLQNKAVFSRCTVTKETPGKVFSGD
jgi:hypothetical protein